MWLEVIAAQLLCVLLCFKPDQYLCQFWYINCFVSFIQIMQTICLSIQPVSFQFHLLCHHRRVNELLHLYLCNLSFSSRWVIRCSSGTIPPVSSIIDLMIPSIKLVYSSVASLAGPVLSAYFANSAFFWRIQQFVEVIGC